MAIYYAIAGEDGRPYANDIVGTCNEFPNHTEARKAAEHVFLNPRLGDLHKYTGRVQLVKVTTASQGFVYDPRT